MAYATKSVLRLFSKQSSFHILFFLNVERQKIGRVQMLDFQYLRLAIQPDSQ